MLLLKVKGGWETLSRLCENNTSVGVSALARNSESWPLPRLETWCDVAPWFGFRIRVFTHAEAAPSSKITTDLYFFYCEHHSKKCIRKLYAVQKFFTLGFGFTLNVLFTNKIFPTKQYLKAYTIFFIRTTKLSMRPNVLNF